jgi:hypothetical protein
MKLLDRMFEFTNSLIGRLEEKVELLRLRIKRFRGRWEEWIESRIF